MNREKFDDKSTTCRHCGKNLNVLKAENTIVESDNKRFCSYSCAEMSGLKFKRPKQRSYRD